MKYLRDLKDLEGVKVLMRLDLNVPIKNGKVVDDFRIRKVLPTIKLLKEKKAKIILISHIEKGGDKSEGKPTLAPVSEYFKKEGIDCVFLENYKHVSDIMETLPNGGIILLENLRQYEGETKNDKKFAQELASLADIYINEAFAVSHRNHASVSAITSFIPSYAGLLFEQEVKNLSSAFNPDHPFLFILGGAKFETKLPLIEKFINIADKVFIGGALASNFFKEMGRDIGKSLVSPENYNLSRFFNNPRLMLPVDNVIVDNSMLDVGPESMKLLEHEINGAKYILWNGTLGAYEQGYVQPSLDLADMLAKATQNGAKTIIGGGDTLAAIDQLKLEDKISFISTGGGAMLEFLAKGTLPGIEALEKVNE
jgi:phosphoglycerate kinase